MDDALCSGSWEIFDSTEPAAVEHARRICLECPVQRACADLAREVEPITGVWAGRPWRPVRCEQGHRRLMHGEPVEVPA